MGLAKIIHAPTLKKNAERNWKEFVLSLRDSSFPLEDDEYGCAHVTDISGCANGTESLRIACEVMGSPAPPIDQDEVYFYEENLFEKWTNELVEIMGDEGYSVERFHDGSISIVYRGDMNVEV